MQLGRFTELQKYNVPISTVQLTKRQAKQASFGHSSARIPNFVSLLATVPGAHRFNNTQSQSVVRRVDGNYTASDCQQKADHNSATDVPPPPNILLGLFRGDAKNVGKEILLSVVLSAERTSLSC